MIESFSSLWIGYFPLAPYICDWGFPKPPSDLCEQARRKKSISFVVFDPPALAHRGQRRCRELRRHAGSPPLSGQPVDSSSSRSHLPLQRCGGERPTGKPSPQLTAPVAFVKERSSFASRSPSGQPRVHYPASLGQAGASLHQLGGCWCRWQGGRLSDRYRAPFVYN